MKNGADVPSEVASFLRWAGSKRQQVSFLRTLVPVTVRRYVEPFAGSASLFFVLNPPRAVLGDLNGELIATFQAVALNPVGVYERLAALPHGRENYYYIRDEWKARGKYCRAARFIYLNRFCFNGLYRTNSSGAFNVPYGRPKNNNIPSKEQLVACASSLRRAVLIAGDFRDTLAAVERDDFVYLDPPYAVRSRRVFAEYGKKVFNYEDLSDVGASLHRLDGIGAKFVLSYADSSDSRRIFAPWYSRRVRVQRNVAGFTSSRRHQYEIYVSNVQSSFFAQGKRLV